MKKQTDATKPARGRPPRADDPRRLTVNLPGELRQWLRVHAVTTERDMGDIVAEALSVYRSKAKGPRRANRRDEGTKR